MAEPASIIETHRQLLDTYEAAKEAYRKDPADPLGWWGMREHNRARRFGLLNTLGDAAQRFPGVDEHEIMLLPPARGVWAYAIKSDAEDGTPIWAMYSTGTNDRLIACNSPVSAGWDAACERWGKAVAESWGGVRRYAG